MSSSGKITNMMRPCCRLLTSTLTRHKEERKTPRPVATDVLSTEDGTRLRDELPVRSALAGGGSAGVAQSTHRSTHQKNAQRNNFGHATIDFDWPTRRGCWCDQSISRVPICRQLSAPDVVAGASQREFGSGGKKKVQLFF